MGGRFGRGIAAPLCAALVAVAAVFTPYDGRAAGAPTPEAFESRVLALVNQERAKRGLRRLERARCPDSFASRWSEALARREKLRHQSVRALLDGCGARRAAENIGTSSESADHVMQGWMRSRRHRANILDPRLRQIGVGAARSQSGRWYVVQNFVGF